MRRWSIRRHIPLHNLVHRPGIKFIPVGHQWPLTLLFSCPSPSDIFFCSFSCLLPDTFQSFLVAFLWFDFSVLVGSLIRCSSCSCCCAPCSVLSVQVAGKSESSIAFH